MVLPEPCPRTTRGSWGRLRNAYQQLRSGRGKSGPSPPIGVFRVSSFLFRLATVKRSFFAFTVHFGLECRVAVIDMNNTKRYT